MLPGKREFQRTSLAMCGWGEDGEQSCHTAGTAVRLCVAKAHKHGAGQRLSNVLPRATASDVTTNAFPIAAFLPECLRGNPAAFKCLFHPLMRDAATVSHSLEFFLSSFV